MICVAVPPGARQRDLAQLAGVEVFALGLQVMLSGALLHADLADAIVDARRFHDRRALFDLQRERLLDVDVLAGVERVDGHARVPVIGRGDEGGVDFLGLEQLAMVGEIWARVRRLLLGGVDFGAVDVADGDDIDVLVRLELRPCRACRGRRSR